MPAAPITWLLAGLVVCCAEALVPGVYLIWFGLAAVLTGAALFAVALPLPAQVALFAALAALSVLVGRLWTRRQNLADPNAAAAELIGQPCRAIAFNGPQGRVRFRDSEWAARSTATPVNPGDALRIVALDGTWLVVEPVET